MRGVPDRVVPDRAVRGAAAPSGRLLQRLDAFDLALYRRAAAADSPLPDAVLPGLTRSADHGLLWLGAAAVLGVSGGPRRAAAVRGLLSLGLASLSANVPAKLATRRERPQLHPVPLVRHLRRQPATSSFPSGHSASAAAFVAGVAMEEPLLAVPLGVLGAGVAYGRVHAGVHYPGDVAAGLVLGLGAALAVRRVWPVRPVRPAVSPPVVMAAPALPAGEGLVVVVDTSAGGGSSGEAVERDLAGLLPDARVVLAAGGEVADGRGHLLLRAASRSLVVYRPAPGAP